MVQLPDGKGCKARAGLCGPRAYANQDLSLPAAPGRMRKWGEEPRGGGGGHRGLGLSVPATVEVYTGHEEELRLTRECRKFREGKRHTEGLE